MSKGNTATTSDGDSVYNSQSQPHPVLSFALHATSYNIMDKMAVTLTVGTNDPILAYFGPPSELVQNNHWSVFGFQVDAGSLPTGVYDWTLHLEFFHFDLNNGYQRYYQQPYTSRLLDSNGNTDPNGIIDPNRRPLQIVNRDDSQYGAGWSRTEDERLVIQNGLAGRPDGVALVTGNSNVTWFYHLDAATGDFQRASNPYTFSDLHKDDNGTGITTDDTYILTDPDGTVHTFDYQGKIQSIVDRNDNALATYTYGMGSDADKITDIVDQAGRVSHFSYTAGLLTSVTDFFDTDGAQTTSYDYTSVGGTNYLHHIIAPDPDGMGPLASPVTTYGYNANGLLDSVIDPRGLETTVTYDQTRHVESITERCGGVINVTSLQSMSTVDQTYSANDPVPDEAEWEQLHASLNPSDINSTSFAEATAAFANDLFETQDIYGEIRKVIRDTYGNILFQQNASQAITQFKRETNPDALVDTLVQSDPIDPSSTLSTSYYHDEYGRVAYIGHPIGYQEWNYGNKGQLLRYHDGTHDVSYVLDSNGNAESKSELTDNGWVDTLYTYTVGSGTTGIGSFATTKIKGLLESTTDPNGNTTLYTYYEDDDDPLTEVDHIGLVKDVFSAYGTPDETTIHYDYDDRDRVHFVTDARGNVTEYVYDNLDRLIYQVDPDPDGIGTGDPSPVWQYSYDPSGNQTHVIDPLGNATEYVYDTRGRLASETQHSGYQSPPIAHWKLDAESGTLAFDSSDSGATATVTGSENWATGKRDNGFQFNGSTKIEAAGLLGKPANVSVAAWANLTSADSSGAEVVSLGDHFALRLDSGGTSGAFFYTGSTWVFLTVSRTFAGTGWHHFAATFDDTNNVFKLYIDGELAASTPTSSSISYTGLGSNTVIGQNGNGWAYTDFTGTIDDVRVYDYAIDAAQVANLYAFERSPVAYWKLDETTGTSTANSIATGPTGTVTGTTDWTAGKYDNGFEFDGATKIQATGLLTNSANVTVAAWANLTDADSGGAEVVSLGDHFAIRLDSGGYSEAIFYNGSTWIYTDVHQNFEGTGWHHFAATFDDTNNILKFYVDGEVVDTTTTTSSINYAGLGANTIIGRHGNNGTNWDFNGTIDDVRVYDYALSADQIAELYQPTKITTAYHFDCNGNLTEETTAAGTSAEATTSFDYDELNQLITRTDADPDGTGSMYTSPITHYTYNSLGWLTEVAPNCRTLQVLRLERYTEAQRSVRWRRSRLSGMAVRGGSTARI